MELKALVHHPGMQLRVDAANSLARFEAAHGVQPITSAFRSVAYQQSLIDRWNRGGAANRPPYLFKPAMPANTSRHTLGTAVDTSAPGVFHTYGLAFGWEFNFAYDVVHFEYNPARDTHAVAVHAPGFSSTVQNEQSWLDHARGEKLAHDGIAGPLFHAAVKRYQTYLHLHYGYTGAIDGLWGPGTQVAHRRYYDAWHRHH